MGVCCVKPQKQEEGEFKELARKGDMLQLDHGGEEKKIVLVQSLLRRFLALRYVRKMKEGRKTEIMADSIRKEVVPSAGQASGSLNAQSEAPENLIIENEKVKEVEGKLQPFQYLALPNKTVERERRPPVILDNNMCYTGEWYEFRIKRRVGI